MQLGDIYRKMKEKGIFKSGVSVVLSSIVGLYKFSVICF